MTPETLAAMQARGVARVATVLATRLPDGAQRLFGPGLDTSSEHADPATAALEAASAAALATGQATVATIAGEAWFLHVHLPPARLLILGAVHIAQSLSPLARMTGLDPVVIDPRDTFATEERFPGTALRREWPDDAIDRLGPDRSTAIVVLSHDPKLDDPALDRALRSDAFYVGALGSKRSHASRLGRLREAGHGEAALARIRGPVGLPIGARTPSEIALSIVAEIVATRRGGALATATR